MNKYLDPILYATAVLVMVLVIAGAMAQEESAKQQQTKEIEKQEQIDKKMPLIMQVPADKPAAKQSQVPQERQQRKFGYRLRRLIRRQ